MEHFAISAANLLLLFLVLPLWIGAGLADYFCHRATSIQTTSGTFESLLHLAQFALVGIPVTAALFFQINAGYFLFAFVFLLFHHAVAAVDLVYANSKRRVAPREQMVHSFLEIMPLTAYILLGVSHAPQLFALFGKGPEPAVFSPILKPLPLGLVVAILSSAFLLNFVPYLEELWRCVTQPQQCDTQL